MWCNLCARQSQPGDRGWVSILHPQDGNRKPLVVTYCPACLGHAVAAPDAEPGEDED